MPRKYAVTLQGQFYIGNIYTTLRCYHLAFIYLLSSYLVIALILQGPLSDGSWVYHH